MADRNAAAIFGSVFKILADSKGGPYEADVLASKIYDLSTDYDFHEVQMEADDACIALGLARYESPSDPDDEWSDGITWKREWI